MTTRQPLISRRAAIGGGLAGLRGLLLFPGQLMAGAAVPTDSSVVLLKRRDQPVVRGPDLGLSSVFTGSDFVFVDDGVGEQSLEGTFELTVVEATGTYRPFVGGHNDMVDKLHVLAPGDGSGGFEEYCFCFVSQP